MEDIKEKALKIMEKNDVGVMATISGNKPMARYMSFYSKGFTLYTITDKRTEKVEDLEKNSNVFVLLGYEEGIFDKDYVEVEGEVSMVKNQEIIEKSWNDYMDDQYASKEDPNILVLEIKPTKINVKSKKGKEVEEIIL
ncbi:pyridoxamine 5'-phosphate oxidase family protein [Marinilactibacillus psychrotolerans]|uniref:General stress protein n=2 Tax=Marinilactibacillus psychrotolerans TaxID=191770 RepID=A0A511H3T0_9LACT|nr:pyridoxamine 5'-phosphate oxidase family protein [Marinilactibacillus psychrotolerans]TLQ07467.1 general stress protein [Marinilactibacillus psychrotolerans]SDD46641.1 General stress protein 26 [Marinilactibacillus psychrotolerans]SJN46149.1 General stress protein 26 [Marinilactibacillus psychrotolerans 42ea]GEL68181.1 general stress protein [Marinilactibacillus psychrotolerans]GEQ32866.1 general stress protein [Marinilactibacillus psychrotolerans]